MTSKHHYQPGDWVIYRKQKSSTSPGPRAENIHAAPRGNLYRYTVEKFWVIDSVGDDGTLLLRTRRGKRHQVAADDPLLHKARFWERWIHSNRFELIANSPADDNAGSQSSDADTTPSSSNDATSA
ncbi:hypothetical protein [Aporhodopirellula aestuarii]|uniref:DUF1653 domain-containing protein n=1 Tax=Aporhodopirellula aestuarii TaxID=2950107 RepID=A0ABT0U5M6_9BACT|nr:hypothetical protein [Aporhodopirellula aestuarii]MCM2372237.1 hypothetical protein [Aporhodopirellula aestuarii]